MKKIYTVIVTLVFSLQTLVASAGNNTVADNNSENSSSIFYINAPRFVRPLIEKWIQEYKKEVPGVNFAIAKTQAAKNSSVLSIQLSDESSHKDASQKTAFFGSYAILPFTTKNSEAAKALENQQLGTKKLKALFFESEDLDEEDTKNNKFSQITIYSGNSKESISKEFAAFYGKEASNFRGKRIVGDDLFLNTAIAKDPQGISFNALANLYDLSTRKVKDGITLLNLDYNKEEKTALAENSSIDALLDVLETSKDTQIPVEKIGFTYQNASQEATQFLAWILTQGQQYNHEYGIMRLPNKLLAEQAKSLPNRLTAQK